MILIRFVMNSIYKHMRLLATICLVFCAFALNAQTVKTLWVTNLKCEGFTNPLGVESLHPLLNWQIQSKTRNTVQSAFRILVSDDPQKLSALEGNVWDSKKIN